MTGTDDTVPAPRLRLDVVTAFPDYLAPLRLALPGRAIDRGILDLEVHDLRAWAHDVHRSVDDTPFGGGPGMVMRPTVWGEALDELVPPPADDSAERSLLIVPTPAGRPFTQDDAHRYARRGHLLFACGRYEGIDQRVIDEASTRMDVEEVSIGDYVLIGGEVAVLVMAEAVVRLLPGVLGNQRSHEEDSFSDGLLEGPSYTRPEEWRGRPVPAVLRSGDHAKIARWRRDESLRRTAQRRPELLDGADLRPADLETLASVGWTPRAG
ncbi:MULTISPECIES: tRNA (guanosine(37)-N1)-methyltransferase TrmD [Dietzia]|uniref:tRNA (guanine-N(1)-)-methyltransferase n=1 Tax=Dietzia cercidiphylli TaxID=498199 RepID=A0ABN2I2D1_9ACTN|nr:tRNA (guanosine(37)-N1)-methyltransferase TrmD [Dietzia cercidiphylli]MBB1041692.1 tRNA (guanosine(37)-N1)-methyltransferase TrmD [Dietzia sp. Cai40]MBB1044089.1 tRNA (guanosine(37)-N1)-methyltransferase TrmD [Dietzia sp. DQ11-44]MBB1051945.1 tRNA (guanosine(37)-N1)-methyltransferase TrmD [Dietzia sp. CW19]MBB1057436.1 tRNA (guanosine(37)-N1)-methyltransferase TrmD [Dietzia sp. B19]MBB1047235.1 tRNA (guanosine(37)-N1)-methyltransferase TrmD [Dietzia cercidiphylli]